MRSREQDVGLWWREGVDGPLHRAAWISDTGELYLVRLGPDADGGGGVEVLARIERRERLEWVLGGWRDHCGEPGSLGWLRRRAALVRRIGSPDGGPARRRAPAPRRPRSPRTAGTAA